MGLERLGELLGHGIRVDVAPLIFKAKKKYILQETSYCPCFIHLWFHICFGLSSSPWISSTAPFPFFSLQDTPKLAAIYIIHTTNKSL